MNPCTFEKKIVFIFPPEVVISLKHDQVEALAETSGTDEEEVSPLLQEGDESGFIDVEQVVFTYSLIVGNPVGDGFDFLAVHGVKIA
jgi:hypothetical protein